MLNTFHSAETSSHALSVWQYAQGEVKLQVIRACFYHEAKLIALSAIYLNRREKRTDSDLKTWINEMQELTHCMIVQLQEVVHLTDRKRGDT